MAAIVKRGAGWQAPPMDIPGFDLRYAVPPLDDYLRLRPLAGLSPHERASAEVGLANSCIAVTARHNDAVIGMGRVIGDGGLNFQVVDIAVLPAYQGQGLGKQIMAAISDWLRANVPESGFVSLLADGEAQHLYAHYGFVPTAPASIGIKSIGYLLILSRVVMSEQNAGRKAARRAAPS